MTIIFLDKSVKSTCTLLSPLQETLLSYMTKLLVLGIIVLISCGTVSLMVLGQFSDICRPQGYGFHPIKNFRNCALKKLRRFLANFCHEIVCENDQTYIFRFVRYLSTFFHTYLPINFLSITTDAVVHNFTQLISQLLQLICRLITRDIFMPPRLLIGGHIVLPLSVHSSHLVCIVCPANSSYSFRATALIFCRMFIHIMEVCMSTGF